MSAQARALIADAVLFLVLPPDPDTAKCSDQLSSTERESLLDKVMTKYFTSERLKSVPIPEFNYTTRVGLANWHMEFYNGTILGLNAIERVGSNYFQARRNDTMRIRAAFKLSGFNISIAFRKKNTRKYTHVKAKAFAPVITFVAEVQE